ncbi:MAG: hypothetical protein NVS1B7_2330 [Candidatus Saccharimonadales bacterium]
MNGILLIDKPSGWTSFDVVAKVRGIVRSSARAEASAELISTGNHNRVSKIKVGHTGTLDPLATGLLVILLGDYCKKAQEYTKLDKSYDVTVRLGYTSETGDEEGIKLAVSTSKPSQTTVKQALRSYTGDIMQKPPAYSAIKVNGERAYKVARSGRTVDLEARPVKIHSITLLRYEYPNITFQTLVGSGTYIRSLVEDIGSLLKTGAYTAQLRRTSVGDWDITHAVSIGQLNTDNIQDNLLTT